MDILQIKHHIPPQDLLDKIGLEARFLVEISGHDWIATTMSGDREVDKITTCSHPYKILAFLHHISGLWAIIANRPIGVDEYARAIYANNSIELMIMADKFLGGLNSRNILEPTE